MGGPLCPLDCGGADIDYNFITISCQENKSPSRQDHQHHLIKNYLSFPTKSIPLPILFLILYLLYNLFYEMMLSLSQIIRITKIEYFCLILFFIYRIDPSVYHCDDKTHIDKVTPPYDPIYHSFPFLITLSSLPD